METSGLIDPWLSRSGAWFGSWHQLPANDHLVTPGLLSPDWVVVTSDREDHCDLATLAQIRPGTPVYVPEQPSKRLALLLRAHTRLDVVEVQAWSRVLLDASGAWLTLTPWQRDLRHGAAVLVTIDGETLLDCHDLHVIPAQIRRARLALGHRVDVMTVTAANPSWYPVCYEYPPDRMLEISRERRVARFEQVAEMLRLVEPEIAMVFGPPCFLDPTLAHHNRWIAFPGILADPMQAIEWLAPLLPRQRMTALLPGDRWFPAARLVLEDPRSSTFSYSRVEPYLRDYAYRRALEISRVNVSHPDPDSSLGQRFAAHFARLALLSDAHVERIAMTVRFDVDGPGGGRWDVHLYPRATEIDLAGRALRAQYRFRVASRWLAPVVAGTATWQDLLFSLRFAVARDPDVYNRYFFDLLMLADRDALAAGLADDGHGPEAVPTRYGPDLHRAEHRVRVPS